MKKTIRVLTAVGMFTAVAPVLAQTNVTIYGVADAGIVYNDSDAPGDSKTWGVGSGMQSGSRIGFRGTEDLGGGLSAIFTLENGFTIDDGAQGQGRLFGRQAFVGLSGGFGAVKIGRQYNPIRLAVESVDPFALGLAGDAKNVFAVYGERADNTINYSSPKFGGVSAQVAYSFGEITGNTSAGRQIGASVGYGNGPIGAVLAYHRQNLLSGTPATTPNGHAHSVMLGGFYNLNVVKLHAAYGVNKGEAVSGATNLDSRDMMIGVSAPVGSGTILASYLRKNNELIADADTNVMAIGYTHDLSKRTNLYTSYARVKNDARGVVNTSTSALSGAAIGRDPSVFNIGVRHRF